MSSVPIGSNRYANYSVSVNFIWYSLSLNSRYFKIAKVSCRQIRYQQETQGKASPFLINDANNIGLKRASFYLYFGKRSQSGTRTSVAIANLIKAL